MSVFLIANIEVRGSEFTRFTDVMGEVTAAAEAAGWKLNSAYVLRTGQLGTVIDIWELDDFDHMQSGMAAIAAMPRCAQIQAVLQAAIIKETLSFADKLTYPPPRPA